MLLKICGASRQSDIEILGAAGADLVGLWYGIQGGTADLSLDQLVGLAGSCHKSGAVEPVVVTFLSDPAVLVDVLECSGVRWLQLHGYQPPGLIKALKRSLPELTVVKVLHIRGEECVERPLLTSYERAGADLFLFDSTTPAGKVGSTAQALDSVTVLELAECMSLPFLLAGGVSVATRRHYEQVVAHRRLVGIDVDTAARTSSGLLSYDNVTTIRLAWSLAGAKGA